MNILITNDDGIYAPGIYAIAKEALVYGNVFVVAPDSERSAIGHAITMHTPLKAKEMNFHGLDDVKAYAVNGTPADCVKLAVEAILKDIDIDIVISGINNGSNLGTDVVYSGTVSAAMEGLILSKPSIAISYDGRDISPDEYKRVAEKAMEFIQKNIESDSMFKDTVTNINFPNMNGKEIKGYKLTRLGIRKYENAFEERRDPRGNIYYWMGGSIRSMIQDPSSDISAVEQGYVSITPLKSDLTNYEKMEKIADLFQKW